MQLYRPCAYAMQVPQKLHGKALYPAICLKNAELAVNFGADALRFGPPEGAVGLWAAPASCTETGGQPQRVTLSWPFEGPVKLSPKGAPHDLVPNNLPSRCLALGLPDCKFHLPS